MATEAGLPLVERVLQLLRHLGIHQAHFAASTPHDWEGLVTTHPEVISSLTLVTPSVIDPRVLGTLADFSGDLLSEWRLLLFLPYSILRLKSTFR